MAPSKSKAKDVVKPVLGFSSNSTCNLPLWDDAHILQENWGAPLVAVAGAMPVAKEARPSKVNKDGTSGAFYTDAEGRTVLQRFIQYYGKDCSPITAELALHAANEGAESPPGSGEVPPRLTPDATPKEEDPPLVEWQRPVDIVRPFRPVVHRNLTPYIDPYASTEELHPVDAKAEEARCRAESAAIQSTAGGKRGDAASKGADVAPVAPLFELYPETVSLIEDLVGQDVGMWQNLHSAEAIRRYRELPALIEPYDPTLTAGCSETPAEACRSRYSTALRYKLQRAEALSALKHIPPFFMSAFNSILLAVEHSQHLVSSGNYLWELIYPHAPGTCHPVYNPFGKYAVKLFVEGAYRKVLVDDALPVDELGRPLISLTARKELWPAILAKAIFKALGPDSHRAMRDHPEQLLSCLMGNWVPQYVATKQDPVATAALLLRYRLRLPSYQESIGKLNEVIPNTQRPQTASVKSPAGANKKSSRASPIADPGEKPQEKKRSSSRKGNKKETPPIPPPLESLAETEAVPINTEEVADTRPMVLCGLRTSTPTDQFGLGSGAQMYTIVDIAPFRNTLAIHMTTTPRTNIVGGLFERERDAKDVRDLVISTKHREGESQVVKDAAIVHCWVTLEELGDILDALVIWRNFDQRYQNQVCIEYPSDASRLTTNQPSKKVSAAQAAAMAAAQSLIRAPKRYTVMWWSLTTVKAEEVAIVSHAPQPPPVPTAEELALAVTPPPSSQSRKAPAAPKAPKQAGGPKKSKNAHEEPPQPVPEPDEQVDTTRWTGNHTSLVVPGSVPNEPKLIQLDYYLWDKAEPISQSITTFYEYGKLCSSVFSLAAGQHIFRLTIPEMEQDEKITLLSDGTMEMKTDLGDILKLCNVFCLSDAGSFPAVERADEESVWFKRKLRVSAPTRLTMVLSTLLPGEDPAAHRHLLAAPPAAKGQKGGGGGNSGRSGQSNKQAAQAAKDSSDDVDHRVCDIPILRYTRLTLMNLDSREETHVGEVGRLAQIDLEPNNRGYLLMAHVLIPSEDAEAVQAAFQSFVVGTSPPPAEDGTTAATSPHQPSLYGKGVWKMALRSDRELAGFDAVAYNTVLYQDKGSLGRGGGAVLFRQSCTVTESSHLTVLADFKVTQAELYVPITLRITNADAAIPSSAGNFVAASPIATKTPAREVTPPVESPDAPHLSIETVVFETTVYGGHIFVPDVFLELPERSRSSAYVVEGFVPEEFASQWDEECRQAQEDKFLASRVEAEKHTSEQRLRELEEISADPNVFVVKKREQQQQQQAAQELAEKSVKETVAPSSKRRRSIDRKKFASTTRNNTPSAAETQEATTKASTSVSTPSPAVPLDTVNSDLLITFSLSLLLSSVKTDVRTMMPAEDYLLLLRDHWKGVPRNQNAPPVEVSSGTSSKGQAANTASSKAKQHQREVAAAEEVLHTEQARQSRQRFLENPRNELLPYVMEEGNAVRSSHGRELPSSKLGTVVPVVISEDGEFNNFKHAPPFDPEDYKVRLLPIRAFELCEASHVEMNIGSHLGASTNGQPGGAKESKRTRNLSMKQSMALSAATSMSVLPSSTQFSPSAAAEEDDTSALREPLVQSMEHYQMAFLTIRNAQKIERQQMKQHVYQYWQSHPTRTVEETPHSAGDAPMSPLMNNYTSIIGTKEDDNPKRVKSLVS